MGLPSSRAFMDPAHLVDLARQANSGRPRGQQALVCKLARQHIQKKPAAAAKRQPALKLEAQIKTINLVHSVTADDQRAMPDVSADADDELLANLGPGRWRMWNGRASLKTAFQAGNASASSIAASMTPKTFKGARRRAAEWCELRVS